MHTSNTNSNHELDEEETNFTSKMIRSLSRDKCNLPFKCFDCGKVGIFASKCPYAKAIDTKGKENIFHKGDKKKNKRSLYSIEIVHPMRKKVTLTLVLNQIDFFLSL